MKSFCQDLLKTLQYQFCNKHFCGWLFTAHNLLQVGKKYLKDEQVHPGCKSCAYSLSPHHHPHIYLALSITVFWLTEGELI